MKIIGRLLVLWLTLGLALPARAAEPTPRAEDPAVHAEVPAVRAAEPEDIGRKALELASEGDALTSAGDVRGASERYRRAFELLPLPSFALSAARNLEWLGQLVEAHSLYLAAALAALPSNVAPEQVTARKTAEFERQKLLRRIPTVIVALAGARSEAVSVSVNGEAVPPAAIGTPRLVNPGRVRVKGVYGRTTVETVVDVVEGEVKPVRLAFGSDAQQVPRSAVGVASAAPRAAGSSRGRAQRLVGYIAMGVGGAVLLTGGAFTLLALEDESDLDARCPMAVCSRRFESDVDTYESKKTIATVGVTVGAVLALAGLTLTLTAPSDEPATAPKLALSLAARGASVAGTF